MLQRILKYLQEIRNYSEDTKRIIGLSVSGGLTFLIVAVCFLMPAVTPVKEVAASKPERNSPSPFTLIGQEFSRSFSNIIKNIPIPSRAGFEAMLASSSSKNKMATSSPETEVTARNATTTENTVEKTDATKKSVPKNADETKKKEPPPKVMTEADDFTAAAAFIIEEAKTRKEPEPPPNTDTGTTTAGTSTESTNI